MTRRPRSRSRRSVDEGVDAALRARAVFDLAEALETQLAERNAALLSEVELPLQRTLARMEQVGVAVDPGARPRCATSSTRP